MLRFELQSIIFPKRRSERNDRKERKISLERNERKTKRETEVGKGEEKERKRSLEKNMRMRETEVGKG